MMTREQLAARLAKVPVKALAAEAKVSTKTIYRLRDEKYSGFPSWSTLQRLTSAMDRMAAPKKRTKATV